MAGLIHQNKKKITFLAGILLIFALFFNGMALIELQQLTLIAVTVIAGIPIGLKALQAIRMKAFSIEMLVTIAVVGALVIGEYTESAVVTFLFLFGDYLEARTLEKTRSSLKNLIDLTPGEATIIREGINITIPVEEVVKGDRVIIRTGGKIPVDGTIISGQALLVEAVITGESVPASKKKGDIVYSGTMIESGYIEVLADKIGDDTVFAKIIELVEEAQDSKTKTEKFLNRFSAVYTPGVVVLSIMVYILTLDVHLAITFLVIACPGALVIGAPVSSVAGIGNGAKNGVLIKGGEVMDRFAKVDTLVFDKTGTLTKGKPQVTDIKSAGLLAENDLLQMVASAETVSEHHLGKTIVKEAEIRGIKLAAPEKSKVKKGSGLMALIGGHCLAIGNRKLMEANDVEISPELMDYAIGREKMGNTAIFISKDRKLAGIISIADQIREDAPAALAEMRKNGIKRIIMLTGDNRFTAERVAAALGLDEFHPELLPADKVKFIQNLQAEGHIVAMAGDGVNDAPAIAAADIGIAMGEGGTDISMETADAVLMADQLLQFSHAFSLSKATIRNMKQNTVLAVGTVAVLLAGVLMGSIHLAAGMFIHEASVLLVILNAMRLMRFNHNKIKKEFKLRPVQA